MKTNITVLISTMSVAALMTIGCHKSSTEEENSSGTNPMAGGSSAITTNMEAGGLNGAWQGTKEGASNAWNATESSATNALAAAGQIGSNAWQETKEVTTNVWDKTVAAFSGLGTTNEISTNFFAYDYSMKDAFVSEAQTNLVHLDARISELSSQVNTTTNSDVQQAAQVVKNKRDELAARLNTIQNATADNWNDARADFIKSYLDLKASLKTAWDSLKAN